AQRDAQGRVAEQQGDGAGDAGRVRHGVRDRPVPVDRRLGPAAGDAGAHRPEGVTMAMKWYVVHTYSGFEKQVVRSLKEHIKNAGMEHKFGEILLPTEEVVEMKSGQKRTSERKFFPGYVLVQMEMDEETWHLV